MIETIEAYAMSIWQWFTENKDAITAFFMSGQFVSFIGALTVLVKNVREVRHNTTSTDTLNKTLANTNKMSSTVDKANEKVDNLTAKNEGLREELKSTEDKLLYESSQMIEKMNAILEVQSIVYSTIRDDSVRQTVNTILNNARYSDANSREQLQLQIDELKKTFDEKMANVADTVDEAINKVSTGLNAAETAKKKAMELKGIEDNTTRY